MATTLIGTLRPHAKGVHVQANAYNIMDVVTSADGSRAFMAVQDVPAGTALDNAAYWCIYTDMSEVKAAMENAAARADASVASANEAINNLTDYTSEYALRVRGEIGESAGNPVAIMPDAGSLIRPVTVFSPKQSGSGDPSPDNVRPINGYDALVLNHVGKNLFNPAHLLGLYLWAKDDNGVYSGPVSMLYQSYNENTNGYPDIHIPEVTQVVLSMDACVNDASVQSMWNFVYTDGTVEGLKIQSTDMMRYTLVSAPGKTVRKLYCTYGNVGTVYLRNMQLEINPSPSAYEPYQADTYTAQPSQTVYGGRMDWNTGILTIDRGYVELDETYEWAYEGGDFRTWLSTPAAPNEANIGEGVIGICSHYHYEYWHSGNGVFVDGSVFVVGAGASAAYGSLENWKNTLAAWKASGTPMQFAYKLAEPFTIQLTPHQILALKGNNTLYGDGDTIETLWVKPLETSIKERTEPLIERIAALEKAILNG